MTKRARVNLVLGYFYGRQMDRSLVAARDAVEAFPGSAMARANLALVAMYASDFETAKSQAEKSSGLHPGYETAYVCLGLSQLALDDTAGAVSELPTVSRSQRLGRVIGRHRPCGHRDLRRTADRCSRHPRGRGDHRPRGR